MRCGQNGMDARREAPPIVDLLVSRVTPRTPVLAATLRDGRLRRGARSAGAGADAQAPAYNVGRSRNAPLPAPRFAIPSPGCSFAPGVVARSLCGPAKPRRSRLAGNETRPIAHVNDYEIGSSHANVDAGLGGIVVRVGFAKAGVLEDFGRKLDDVNIVMVFLRHCAGWRLLRIRLHRASP
jgi:hypothetical protein